MSESSTFATAAPAPASTSTSTLDSGVAAEKSSISGNSTNDLLYTYQDEAKRPYMADYLGVQNIWDKEPVLKSELDLLENYLRKMVVEKKIDNNTDSAKKYVDYLSEKAGIEPFESATSKIAKLLKYINFRKVVDS